MTTVEMIQTGLALAGVAGIGGVWFRLGSLIAKNETLTKRVDKIENHVFLGGYKA